MMTTEHEFLGVCLDSCMLDDVAAAVRDGASDAVPNHSVMPPKHPPHIPPTPNYPTHPLAVAPYMNE